MTAGLSNKGDAPLKDVPVTLNIDGHEIQTEHATIGAHASASVTFTQFTLVGPNVRGFVHAGIGSDAGGQHVQLRPDAERAGVGGDRRQRRPRRHQSLPRQGARDRHDADLPGRVNVDDAADAVDAREARGGGAERHAVPVGSRRRRAEAFRRARRRPADRGRRSHDMAAGRVGPAAGTFRRQRRSHHRPQRLARLSRLQPSGVRGVQGAAQRRLLRRARLPLSRADHRARRSRHRPLRRWRGGGGGEEGRRRPRHRVDDDARRLVRPTSRSSRSTCRWSISWCAISHTTSRRRRG